MFWSSLKAKHARKDISCPSCHSKTIAQVMVMGGAEAVCENCKTTVVALNYKRQSLVSLITILSCILPVISIYLIIIPLLAFHFSLKFFLKTSKHVMIKDT